MAHHRAGLAPPRPRGAAHRPCSSPSGRSTSRAGRGRASVLMVITGCSCSSDRPRRRGRTRRHRAAARSRTSSRARTRPGSRGSHVVFPFLMSQPQGRVRRRRNIEFARVGGKTAPPRRHPARPRPVPGGGARRPALMQIHGGGWVIGDKREQGIPLLNHMAAQGWVGFNVNYRLSPGVAFPDHLIDLKRGLAWIREHADEYGDRPRLRLRHRRLRRRPPHRADGAHRRRSRATSPASRTPTPRWPPPCRSTASTTSPPQGAFGSDPSDLPAVPRADRDEGVRADEPEKFEDASPLHHITRGRAAVLRDPRRPRHPRAGGGRPRLRRAAPRACPKEPVLYAEMQGAQHAFEVFPSFRTARVIEGVERFLTTIWERRHAGAPSRAGRGRAGRRPHRLDAAPEPELERVLESGRGLRRHARGGGLPRRGPGLARGQRHPEGPPGRLLGGHLVLGLHRGHATSSGAASGRAAWTTAGWAGITWPTEVGGRGGRADRVGDLQPGAGPLRRVRRRVHRRHRHGRPDAPRATAPPEQQQRYLPAMLRGDEVWCQLFSETRGRLRPRQRRPPAPCSTATSGWSPGQKVWTCSAAAGGVGDPARPHRSRRAQAPGHHLLPASTWRRPASTSGRCGR